MTARDSLWQRFVDWAKTALTTEEDRRRKPVREDATVRRTRQVTGFDCGIAALSMILDIPYKDARAALFAKGERCLGTEHARMLKAFKQFGVKHGRFRKFQSWEAIPSHALVEIRWKDARPKDANHWVVFQKRASGESPILDPASFADTLTTSDPDTMIGIEYCTVAIAERGKPSRPRATKRRVTKKASRGSA